MADAGSAGLAMPALPTIGEADLKAIQDLIPGKRLGRVAALLGLLRLALASGDKVDEGLKRVVGTSLPDEPWLRFAVLIGLPALVVITQLFVEYRASRTVAKIRRRVGRGALRLFPHGPLPEHAG